MKCPKCGESMLLGEIANARGDSALYYWVPQAFLRQHILNPYCHTKKTIERGGGIIIKSSSIFRKTSTCCYGCEDCMVIVVDCNEADSTLSGN